MTHQVWRNIFFCADSLPASNNVARGWLEHRYGSSVDKQRFAQEMASVHLAISLMAWALAVRISTKSVEESFCADSKGQSTLKPLSCVKIKVLSGNALYRRGLNSSSNPTCFEQCRESWKLNIVRRI
jgi:hypothetical protein